MADGLVVEGEVDRILRRQAEPEVLVVVVEAQTEPRTKKESVDRLVPEAVEEALLTEVVVVEVLDQVVRENFYCAIGQLHSTT